MGVVPRVGEFVMLDARWEKPWRVSMVVYDLHRSPQFHRSNHSARVLLERMI
jgi:hypothetical protein